MASSRAMGQVVPLLGGPPREQESIRASCLQVCVEETLCEWDSNSPKPLQPKTIILLGTNSWIRSKANNKTDLAGLIRRDQCTHVMCATLLWLEQRGYDVDRKFAQRDLNSIHSTIKLTHDVCYILSWNFSHSRFCLPGCFVMENYKTNPNLKLCKSRQRLLGQDMQPLSRV